MILDGSKSLPDPKDSNPMVRLRPGLVVSELMGHFHNLCDFCCEKETKKIGTASFTQLHIDRVIGLHNHFPYEGLVHPITLSMCS